MEKYNKMQNHVKQKSKLNLVLFYTTTIIVNLRTEYLMHINLRIRALKHFFRYFTSQILLNLYRVTKISERL